MAAEFLQRRQFLRGDFAAQRLPIRPPWAIDEASFISRCTRCRACQPVCPDQLIQNGSGGFPELDFSHAGCAFCGACALACPTGALQKDVHSRAPWTLQAQLAPGCLAVQGVVCRSCSEQCEAEAIRFKLHRNGVAQPQIDVDLCTGCGACIGVCPSHALKLRAAPQNLTSPHNRLFPRERVEMRDI